MKMTHKPRISVPPPPKKPVLLMNIGVGWAATTPFLYTLTIDQKYCHPGHVKENHYLRTIFEQDCCNSTETINFTLETSANPEQWVFRWWQKELYEYTYHFKDNPDYITEWYSDVTIKKYIDYYLKHWEVIKTDFHAVADFSNHNWSLPYWENGKEMIDKIMEVFDLKVTVQFRDPIRRLYSEMGTCFIDEQTPYIPVKAAEDKRETGERFIRNNQHNKFFNVCLKDGAVGGANCQYGELYTKWEELVGKDNILVIIMEEFWNPQYREQQCERLSNFLEVPIKKVHQNAYFPDMGADAPHYLGLIDQWTSDKETITEETIEKALKYMKPCYTDFKDTFGYIPEAWTKYED